MEIENPDKIKADIVEDNYCRLLCMLQDGLVDCAKQGNKGRSIFIVSQYFRDVVELYMIGKLTEGATDTIMVPDIQNDGADIFRVEGIATFYDTNLPDKICIVMPLKYWHDREKLKELEEVK